MAERMAKGKLSMDDFLKQMRTLRRMGSMKQLLGMLPGMGSMMKNVDIDDGQLDRLEGIVHSMTPRERDDIKTLDKSRNRSKKYLRLKNDTLIGTILCTKV